MKFYVASKSIHAPQWRAARDKLHVPIISTWIDEAGVGETSDFGDLWSRCIAEASEADALVAFHVAGETWKGAFIEIGAALAAKRPVYVVGDPPGSWTAHALVTRCPNVMGAFRMAGWSS